MSVQPPGNPEQRAETLRWLRQADLDVDSATTLLASSEALVEPAAFHCQQAAEKMAKALLVFAGREPPHIHDIERLGHSVGHDFAEIARAFDDMADLTSWYIAGRYPTPPDSGVSIEDVRQVLEKLRNLRQQISAVVNDQR